MQDHDDAWGGFVAFCIAWCVFGVIGLIPWSHPDVFTSGNQGQGWVWHMYQPNAWWLWGLIVSLAAGAVGFIAYAIKRWSN